MSILSILNELASTNSSTEKVAILQREKDNELLKRVFHFAYNPMITYGIKQIPEYCIGSPTKNNWSLNKAIDELQKFSSREVTGNDAINHLKFILQKINNRDNCTVFERIIQRDLRCGTSDSLASRVWPGIVPTFDVMLAHKDISGIKYPAYGQIKSDGARCIMTRQGNKAVAFSRNGKPIELKGVFDDAICTMVDDGETLDGELLAVQNGKILDRKTSNGFINKAVKGTISKEEADMLLFVTWDIVDFTSTIPYKTRIERLTKAGMNKTGNIRVLQTYVINSKDEAEAFFEKCLSEGEEGAMIKNMDHLWAPKRSKDIGKMKAEEVADLKIVGIVEGTGKYAGKVGSYICQTEDGILEVNVGSGLSDEDRASPLELGTIIEVMYNQKITDKKTGKWSLFLPRMMQVRFDKDVANTFGELK